jgi:hypothetical protein
MGRGPFPGKACTESGWCLGAAPGPKYYRRRVQQPRTRSGRVQPSSGSTRAWQRRRLAQVLVVAWALTHAAPRPVHGQEVAGRVKTVSGAAFLVRQQKTIAAQVGAVVFESDLLRTGNDGRLGVTLSDDTRISLGPRTEIRVSRVAYQPAQGQLALVLSIARGVMAYVSGHIARLSADAVRVETPDAVIGIRGTRLAIHVTEQ